MRAIAIYTLLDVMRNRALWLALLLAASGFCLSLFLQQVAVIQSMQIQSGTLALIERTGSVFILVSVVLSGVIQDYHDKSLEFFLAMPISRADYLFGRLSGYAAFSLMLAALLSIPLIWSVPVKAVLVWGTSLFFELVLMSSVSLFFSITLTQMPVALAGVLGFYLLSRSMGTLLLIMNGPLADHSIFQKAANVVLSSIGYCLPNLDEFTRTAWLVYPSAQMHELLAVAVQTCIYSALMWSAALFDFYRREV
jgi:hypothetical protein